MVHGSIACSAIHTGKNTRQYAKLQGKPGRALREKIKSPRNSTAGRTRTDTRHLTLVHHISRCCAVSLRTPKKRWLLASTLASALTSADSSSRSSTSTCSSDGLQRTTASTCSAWGQRLHHFTSPS